MPKLITARCQSCGKESQVQWTLGTKCPHCKSDNFLPVVFIDKSQSASGQRAVGRAPRRPIGMILAVLLFVGGASALIFRLQSTMRQPTYYNEFIMVCTNPDCSNPHPKKLFRARIPSKNVFPHIECPFCKQKTAYRAVQCEVADCREIFPLKTEGKRDPTIGLTCPSCGLQYINLDSSSEALQEELKKGESEN